MEDAVPEPPFDERLDEFDSSGGIMMRIRIHSRRGPNGPWKVTFADVGQIPAVGDYVAPGPIYVFRVLLSLHILFDADYAAEVFAEQVDFDEIQQQLLGRVVWANGPAH